MRTPSTAILSTRRVDPHALHGDLPAVHADPAGLDHVLADAAGADAGAGQHLLQPLALAVVVGSASARSPGWTGASSMSSDQPSPAAVVVSSSGLRCSSPPSLPPIGGPRPREPVARSGDESRTGRASVGHGAPRRGRRLRLVTGIATACGRGRHDRPAVAAPGTAGPVIGQALLGLGGFRLVWAGIALLLVLATVARRTRAGDPHAGGRTGRRRPADPPRGVGAAGSVCSPASPRWRASSPSRRCTPPSWAWTCGAPRSVLYGVVVVTCRIAVRESCPTASADSGWPPRRWVRPSLGLLITASVPAAWGLFVGAAVLAVGTAFLTPAMFAAIFSRVPESQRGSAAGTASVFLDLGFSGGPVAVRPGRPAASEPSPAQFVAGAAVAVAGGAPAGVGGRRRRTSSPRLADATATVTAGRQLSGCSSSIVDGLRQQRRQLGQVGEAAQPEPLEEQRRRRVEASAAVGVGADLVHQPAGEQRAHDAVHPDAADAPRRGRGSPAAGRR